ncbi:MAG: FKBP-type peptidyl-prolyl cis-trans isomerase [Bacteroidota bacterium]
MKQIIPLLFLAVLAFQSCTPRYVKSLKKELIENPESQAEKDKNQILQYAIDKELDIQSTESGIYYLIENPGVGEVFPTKSDIIEAHYHGRLLNDTVFDSSVERGKTFEFKLSGVIKGWQEAIPMLKKGGKGRFFIPSELAYGERGAGRTIKPNTVLSFDIELIDFFDASEMPKRQAAKDQEVIKEYLANNGLTNYKMTESGIHYNIEMPGEGASPTASDKVKAHYTGKLLNGNVFDSSVERGKPLDFKLGGVIKGWQEAIPMLKRGGKGTFIIPSALAYGARGAGRAIPPNAVLLFEIELIDF